MSMHAVYVTAEGLKKLEDELEHLRTVKRQEVATRLHEAMEDGELIENAEYEAAKNEQAFVEGRIKELELLLATARVVDGDTPHMGTAQVGAQVTICEDVDGAEEEVYTIVGAAEANPREGRISNESPLGKALMSKKAGERVVVEAPQGSYAVRLLKVD